MIGLFWGVAWAADTALNSMTNDASPTDDDIIYTVNDPGGTPADRKVTLSNLWTYIYGKITSTIGAAYDTSAELDALFSAKMDNPMTTAGDIVYGGASGAPTRLAGSANDAYVLAYNTSTGAPYWKVDATGAGGDQLVDIVATSPLLVNDGAAVNDALPGSDSDITFSMPAATNSSAGYATAAQITALERVDTDAEVVAIIEAADALDLSNITTLTLPGLKNGSTSAGFLRGYENSTNGTSYFDVIFPESLADNGSVQTTEYGWSLVGVADEAGLKSLVNLEIGTDVQAYDADLGYIAGISMTQGGLIMGGAAQWGQLTPGTAGLPLVSGGTGENLSYAQLDSGGIANGAVDNVHLSNDAVLPVVISGDPDTLDDTLATNGAALYRGGYIRYNAAGEATIDAFTVAGQNVSILFYPSVAIIVNPNASQTITRNGVDLAQGEALINDSNYGLCVLTYLGSDAIDAQCSTDITEETP